MAPKFAHDVNTDVEKTNREQVASNAEVEPKDGEPVQTNADAQAKSKEGDSTKTNPKVEAEPKEEEPIQNSPESQMAVPTWKGFLVPWRKIARRRLRSNLQIHCKVLRPLLRAHIRGHQDINAAYFNAIQNPDAHAREEQKNRSKETNLLSSAQFESNWSHLPLTGLKVAPFMHINPPDDSFRVPTKFPRFRELDRKVRWLVWAFAIPGPRRHHFSARERFVNPVPAVLHVNREARYLALQVYTLREGVYIDLHRDQVFCWRYPWEEFLDARHICVDVNDLWEGMSTMAILKKFKHLKSVTVFEEAQFNSTILAEASCYWSLDNFRLTAPGYSIITTAEMLKVAYLFGNACQNAGGEKPPGIWSTRLLPEKFREIRLTKDDDNDTKYGRSHLPARVSQVPKPRFQGFPPLACSELISSLSEHRVNGELERLRATQAKVLEGVDAADARLRKTLGLGEYKAQKSLDVEATPDMVFKRVDIALARFQNTIKLMKNTMAKVKSELRGEETEDKETEIEESGGLVATLTAANKMMAATKKTKSKLENKEAKLKDTRAEPSDALIVGPSEDTKGMAVTAKKPKRKRKRKSKSKSKSKLENEKLEVKEVKIEKLDELMVGPAEDTREMATTATKSKSKRKRKSKSKSKSKSKLENEKVGLKEEEAEKSEDFMAGPAKDTSEMATTFKELAPKSKLDNEKVEVKEVKVEKLDDFMAGPAKDMNEIVTTQTSKSKRKRKRKSKSKANSKLKLEDEDVKDEQGEI